MRGIAMKRWRRLASNICGWVSAAAVAGMVLVTVADVLLRWLANYPIRGTLEIVELLLACSFFLAIPATFLREEHIVVDLIDAAAPRAVPVLKRIAEVIAVVVLGTMAWQGWIAAKDTLVFNDVTSDLALPKIWYWIPVLTGIIGAGIAAAFMALRKDVASNRDKGPEKVVAGI
jgi:TRAP-type C4-dicarboxylate transport system permease small subunit